MGRIVFVNDHSRAGVAHVGSAHFHSARRADGIRRLNLVVIGCGRVASGRVVKGVLCAGDSCQHSFVSARGTAFDRVSKNRRVARVSF